MKSVGQQLQEARQAKNWTPELAARETKIKADRIRDLEADDFANFSSPTYARGFVRTYARALGLDEYSILRQLDNKLPEDDNVTFAPDAGMPYVPEPSSQAMHVSAPRTGLYIVLGLGCAVIVIIAFVFLQAYRAGELPRYFASTASTDTLNSAMTNSAPVVDTEAPPHALPVDANDTSHSVRALPVDLNALTATPDTNAAPAATTAAETAPPVPASTNSAPVVVASITPPSTSAPTPTAAPAEAPVVSPAPTGTPAPAPEPPSPPAEAKAPLRALPVSPSELAAAEAQANGASASSPPDSTAAPTNAPTGAVLTTPVDLGNSVAPSPVPSAPPASHSGKRLVLTASRDSFVRVTALDAKTPVVLYASVLHAGQSLSFDNRRFSVNVGVPSAVDIVLDSVYYGPHSDHQSPETFTLESHQP